MTLRCTNKNGWYIDGNNCFVFLELRSSEVVGPMFGEIYYPTGMISEYQGDICYIIEEFPIYGWDADGFEILNEQELSLHQALKFENIDV